MDSTVVQPNVKTPGLRIGVIFLVSLFIFFSFALPLLTIIDVWLGYPLRAQEHDVAGYFGMGVGILIAILLERQLFRRREDCPDIAEGAQVRPVRILTKLSLLLFLLYMAVSWGSSEIVQPLVTIIYHFNGWTSEIYSELYLLERIRVLSVIIGVALLYASRYFYVRILKIIKISLESPGENGEHFVLKDQT